MRLDWRRALYGCTIFTSALLLFLVQPMIAKAILPWFGGSAGVWATCMLFFQLLLLAGYWYAHYVAMRLHPRVQSVVHAALLAGSMALLPIIPAARWKLAASDQPVSGILLLLAATVGLPYFLLSTTTPLVQSWYARTSGGGSPYRLFAVSNLASLAALLAYPVAIEPVLPLRTQLVVWSVAYAGFAVLCGASALASAKGDRPVSQDASAPWGDRLLWMVLAACPAAMWMAVANHLSQSVAPMPFIWILPLGLYLLSLIVCFDRDGWYNPGVFKVLLLVGLGAICLGLWHPWFLVGLRWGLFLFGSGLFLCCMFCHGELARRKPAAKDLTSFYLMVAIGGAAGGAFVALVAPHLFTNYYELQVSLVVCIILGLTVLYGVSSPRQAVHLAVVAVVGFLAAFQVRGSLSGDIVKARNFYGAVSVADRSPANLGRVRLLYNGAILHGAQYLDPQRSRVPTTYYGRATGGGIAMAYRTGAPRKIGVIGLGAGTLATYGRPGDLIRFYEINPLVIDIANRNFCYLRESEARVEVVTGDARLSLEREPVQDFDILALDAFSGDSIPVHLLTREAFVLYFRHLKPGGILAVHVSNVYLDLAPVVARAAESFGKRSYVVDTPATYRTQKSDWVLISDDPDFLKIARAAADPAPLRRIARPWTDDYSNLFRIIM